MSNEDNNSDRDYKCKVYSIFDRLDDWLCEGRFDLVDEELFALTEDILKGFDPGVVLAYLAATSCASDKLENRVVYTERARNVLTRKLGAQRTDALLRPHERP